MVLVRYDKTPPNKTLQGHKLLVLVLAASFTPTDQDVEDLRRAYPGLVVQVARLEDLARDDWKDVTVLLTGASRATLPRKEDVPKLEYVQLTSAGANLVVSDPLFSETDVAFCTANGVHGWVLFFWLFHFSFLPLRRSTAAMDGTSSLMSSTYFSFPDHKYRNGSLPHSSCFNIIVSTCSRGIR